VRRLVVDRVLRILLRISRWRRGSSKPPAPAAAEQRRNRLGEEVGDPCARSRPPASFSKRCSPTIPTARNLAAGLVLIVLRVQLGWRPAACVLVVDLDHLLSGSLERLSG